MDPNRHLRDDEIEALLGVDWDCSDMEEDDELDIVADKIIEGQITVQEFLTEQEENEEELICQVEENLQTESGPDQFPEEVIPEGMTQTRKEYLYKHIREYCKEQFKDVLCPQPEPAPQNDLTTPDDPQSVPGPSAKRRKRSV
ncbi:hypothetical protein LSTR_LSTR002819 [Laodelphax striatellus]|uniref:Uncharacterized protein n=1 Tax=Laodelphax striatellus TaxID=195883 RepID=A0A482XHI6_LAOST|nr:hypothetical protein LSTR_LSTR002819 [Laodelphax striatellus]